MKIDKGVPIPGVVRGWGVRRYPFNQMDVGDSFAISTDDSKAARTAAYCYGGRHNKKFACRKTGDAYRIWRIA